MSLALPIRGREWRAWTSHHGLARRHLWQSTYAPHSQAYVPEPLWVACMGMALVWGSLCGLCCLSCCWSIASSAAVGAPEPLEDQKEELSQALEQAPQGSGGVSFSGHIPV